MWSEVCHASAWLARAAVEQLVDTLCPVCFFGALAQMVVLLC
jgi:hypothetical protein